MSQQLSMIKESPILLPSHCWEYHSPLKFLDYCLIYYDYYVIIEQLRSTLTLEDDTTEKLKEENAEVHLDQEIPPPTEPVDIIVSYRATRERVNKDSLCILEDICL